MIPKSLDAKLARIHADPSGCKDFILADAKDAVAFDTGDLLCFLECIDGIYSGAGRGALRACHGPWIAARGWDELRA